MTEHKSSIKEEIEKTKHQIKEMKKEADLEIKEHREKLEAKSQNSWDKLDEKGLNAYNTIHKYAGTFILVGSSLCIFVAGDTSPLAIILFLYGIYARFIFDAYKMTSEYKAQKKAAKTKNKEDN